MKKYLLFIMIIIYHALLVWLGVSNDMLFATTHSQENVMTSVTFLFVWLPIILLVYYLVPWALKNIILFLAGLLVYSWGEPVYVVLLLLMILFNYVCAKELRTEKSLMFAVGVNFLVLFVCRFLGPVVEGVSEMLSYEVQFPLGQAPFGMTVFTLLSVGYLIDIYSGRQMAKTSLGEYALYATLFPQLTAGLFGRYPEMQRQIRQRKITAVRFGDGAMFLIRGFAKIMILANVAGRVTDQILAIGLGNFSVLTAWIGSLMFAFEIYYALSGCADMAVGLGKMFGFEMKKNFEYPYTAQSVTDFSGRWHMTLTAWFREYVLQPLGGQNVWIVWALIGLCYGASLNYLFWGLYIGLLILFERAVLNRYLVKMAPIFRHLYAWLMLLIGWVFFMSPDMGAAFQYLGTMFGIGAAGFADAYTLYLLKSNWLLLLLAAAGCTSLGYGLFQRVMYNMRTQRVKTLAAGAVYGLLFFVSIAFLVM